MIVDPPPSIKPLSPMDILGYVRKMDVNGIDMYCASENTFFTLVTDMERYVKECETCPSWGKEKGE